MLVVQRASVFHVVLSGKLVKLCALFLFLFHWLPFLSVDSPGRNYPTGYRRFSNSFFNSCEEKGLRIYPLARSWSTSFAHSRSGCTVVKSVVCVQAGVHTGFRRNLPRCLLQGAKVPQRVLHTQIIFTFVSSSCGGSNTIVP